MPPKEIGAIRYLAGGPVRGRTDGCCPGPLVAQIGAGASVRIVAFLSAPRRYLIYGARALASALARPPVKPHSHPP